MDFIISQIIGGIAIVILLAYTLLKVNRKVIMWGTIITNVLWFIHYMLLDAYSGALCSAICAIMSFLFSFKGKNKVLSSNIWPVLFGATFVVIGIVTWDNFYSLLPVTCEILLVIALWLDRELLIKAMCIPVAAIWVIYNLIYFSWLGMIGQALSLVFHIFYVIRAKIKGDTAKIHSDDKKISDR